MFHRTRYGWWFSNQHSIPAGYIEIPGSARILSDLGAGRRAAYRPLLWLALRAWGFLSILFAETLEDDHRIGCHTAIAERFERDEEPVLRWPVLVREAGISPNAFRRLWLSHPRSFPQTQEPTTMTTTADLKCSSLQAGYQGQSHKVTATDAQSPGMPRVLLGWMTPILENPEADTQLIRGIERSPRYVDARIEHVQNRATGDLPPQ